jgi:hypothetical protein
MVRFCLTLVMLLGFLSSVGKADIVFSLSPLSQTITQGSNGIFEVFVRSSSGTQKVDGIDVNVNAGAGNGTGGKFISGVTFLLGSTPFDITTTTGQAFSTNFQLGGIDVGTTDQLYGRLTLDTTGLALGTYTMSLDQLNANSPTLAGLPVQGFNATYTITAIPEPSSVLLVSAVGFYGWRRARRTKPSLR